MRISQSIKEILKKPYLALYSLIIFFTPIVFSFNTNELFEFPKMFFVYIVGFFIMALFFSELVLRPITLKIPSLPVLFLSITVLLSTFFSSHLYTSLFGYYSRFNDGLMSYIVFLGIYFVGINKLTSSDRDTLLKVSLLTILPISFYGLSQYFNGTTRVYSTLGQPNWLAQYLSLLLPLSLYFLLFEKNEKLKILYFVIYVFGFFCFWTTYSVSGIIGFVLSLAILIFRIFKKEKVSKEFFNRGVLVIVITLFIVFSNLGIYKDKINDIFVDLKKQSLLIKNVYASNDTNRLSDPGYIRFELWKSSLKLVFSGIKIFSLGSGPETFPYVFQNFRSENLNFSSEWDFVFNKPHNYYLEIWAESGFLSLIVFIVALIYLYKKTPYYIGPSVVAFVVTSFFGWPVVATSLIFWFFLIIADGFVSDNANVNKKLVDKKNNKNFKIPTLVFIWVIYTFSAFVLISLYKADIYFNKSQDLVKEKEYDRAVFYANKSVELNPFEPNYYRGRAKVNTVFLVSDNDIEKTKSNIYLDLKKAEELNPDNLVTIRNSIPIYYFLAVRDLHLTPGPDNTDDKYIEIVSKYYSKVKNDYWGDVGVLLSLAKYEKRLGMYENYERSISRIKDLRPDILEWNDLF